MSVAANGCLDMNTAAEVSTEELAAKFEEDSDIENKLAEQAGKDMAAQIVQAAQAAVDEQAYSKQAWSEDDCTESEDEEDLAELEEGQQVVRGGLHQLLTSCSLS